MTSLPSLKSDISQVRAPIFEDKAVDVIAELADVSEHKVDRLRAQNHPPSHGGPWPMWDAFFGSLSSGHEAVQVWMEATSARNAFMYRRWSLDGTTSDT